MKADCTTAQPHSLDDRAARLHAPRTCLITTAQQIMYAFHGPFMHHVYYNRVCIGDNNNPKTVAIHTAGRVNSKIAKQ